MGPKLPCSAPFFLLQTTHALSRQTSALGGFSSRRAAVGLQGLPERFQGPLELSPPKVHRLSSSLLALRQRTGEWAC